jgi:hypothetical protein
MTLSDRRRKPIPYARRGLREARRRMTCPVRLGAVVFGRHGRCTSPLYCSPPVRLDGA